MQNLTSGLVELNETEMQDIDGGVAPIVIGIVVVAIILLTPTPAY
jgi:lactobin A/cerein 7B family class IIb bacteriocin